MIAPAKFDCIACALRLVEIEDAAFLYRLRVDPTLSRFLSPVTGGVQDQAAWIRSYKAREAEGREAYYIVETRDGEPCGTVRLYEIGPEVFTWGSFVLTEEKPAKAALDVAVHSLGIGFSAFGCSRAEIDAKHENVQALGFYDRFGMTRIGDKDGSVLLRYYRSDFEADQERFMEIVRHAHARN